jgi:hypothetical protein
MRGKGFGFRSCVEVGLGFFRRDVPDRLKQSAVAELVDAFQHGTFYSLEAAPSPTAVVDLGLEEAVDRLGRCVVTTVADAGD